MKTKIITLLLSTALLLSSLTACAEEVFHFHSWESATCTSPMTCKCGETYGDAKGHNYTAATCTEASKCTRCGKTSGSALGHMTAGSSNLCTNDQICSRCGVTVRSATGHNYSSASCTMAQTCLRCGTSKGSPLGHKFADATCEYPSQCTRCGKTDGNALGHLYDNDTCIRCGQIDPDTLPVNLETLHIIDSSDFSLENLVTDTYGNTHEVAFRYWAYDAYSTHNLNKEFSTFSGSIAVSHEGKGGTVRIYVLHKVVYPARAVQRSGEIKYPSVQIRSILQIEDTLEAACHRLFHQTSAFKLNHSICITERRSYIEAFYRIHREVQLDIVCKRTLSVQCIETDLIVISFIIHNHLLDKLGTEIIDTQICI